MKQITCKLTITCRSYISVAWEGEKVDRVKVDIELAEFIQRAVFPAKTVKVHSHANFQALFPPDDPL